MQRFILGLESHTEASEPLFPQHLIGDDTLDCRNVRRSGAPTQAIAIQVETHCDVEFATLSKSKGLVEKDSAQRGRGPETEGRHDFDCDAELSQCFRQRRDAHVGAAALFHAEGRGREETNAQLLIRFRKQRHATNVSYRRPVRLRARTPPESGRQQKL